MEALERLRRDSTLAEVGLHETYEVGSQGRDVARAGAERRDVDDQAMDSVVEVRTEAPFAHHRAQVCVGGAQQANVDAAPGLAAHAADLPGFEDAKEARLKIGGQLGDLVEKKRAPVRLLERPTMGLDRPCERAALVPKELALDELARKPASIDGHEGALSPPPAFVQRLGDELFADARLTANQNGPWQTCKSIDLGHDGEHWSRFDDEVRR